MGWNWTHRGVGRQPDPNSIRGRCRSAGVHRSRVERRMALGLTLDEAIADKTDLRDDNKPPKSEAGQAVLFSMDKYLVNVIRECRGQEPLYLFCKNPDGTYKESKTNDPCIECREKPRKLGLSWCSCCAARHARAKRAKRNNSRIVSHDKAE